MSKKLLTVLVILSAILWFLILSSISLFLSYWRISNEPGAAAPIDLLWAHRIMFWTSLMGTAAVNLKFIKYKEKKIWIAWIFNLVVTLLYIPFLLFTLLLMT